MQSVQATNVLRDYTLVVEQFDQRWCDVQSCSELLLSCRCVSIRTLVLFSIHYPSSFVVFLTLYLHLCAVCVCFVCLFVCLCCFTTHFLQSTSNRVPLLIILLYYSWHSISRVPLRVSLGILFRSALLRAWLLCMSLTFLQSRSVLSLFSDSLFLAQAKELLMRDGCSVLLWHSKKQRVNGWMERRRRIEVGVREYDSVLVACSSSLSINYSRFSVRIHLGDNTLTPVCLRASRPCTVRTRFS